MALSKKMMDYVCNTAQEAMELLTTLAKIPAPSNHEEKRAEFCRDWFLKAGAKDVYIDDALNVVCKLGECNDEVDVFMAHSDVVFPDLEELPLSVCLLYTSVFDGYGEALRHRAAGLHLL